ncbi:MAG: hypothetical protein JWQ07_246 [Ramlibacter sp.]|nr:hypothetical protein [Ramlibacter sp.]
MRSTLIAIVLCACSAAASAQCLASNPTTAAAPLPDSTQPTAVKHPTGQAVTEARPAPELIKTAGAQTHDGSPSMQASPARSRPAGERPVRTGTAMLLAALALMSGIALRRYTSHDQ